MFNPFRRTKETEEKTEQALEPTRRAWFSRVTGIFERAKIDDELWEELEELLLGADLGYKTTQDILERLQSRVADEGIRNPEGVREALKGELARVLEVSGGRGRLWGEGATSDDLGRPAIVLVVGINGSGKTTSIAKLAHYYVKGGAKVVVAASDTFRAAAVEQLKLWGERVGAHVVAHQMGADPGAVVFDALTAGESRGADVVIIDTAGRLHTKVNLMEELRKIYRVVQRRYPDAPDEVLLVLDATIGQNGLAQARAFAEAVDVTAVCLAKLDGSSKGGSVFAVGEELGIPVRFVGTGEEPEDISPFEPRSYVESLFH